MEAIVLCEYCGHELDEQAVYCPYCATPVDGAKECTDYTYEAFISYRHVEPDGQVARCVQRRLEGFSIPRQLRKEDGPKRLGRLFRDEDELPTSSSLGDQIRDALLHSRFLIVICSPKLNESRWCAREIELFTSFHGRDKVRLALAAGEPDESFPTLLRTRLVRAADGTLTEVDEEPLAADCRDLSHKRLNTEVLRLAAPLVGCGFDDLRHRVRARRQKLIASISSGIAAVSVAFGAFSLYQQLQIEHNYRLSQTNESESLATESSGLLQEGRRMEAIQVALAALPGGTTDPSRPFVPSAQLALEEAMGCYPQDSCWKYDYAFNAAVDSVYAVDKDVLAYLAPNGNVEAHSLVTGERLCSTDVSQALSSRSGFTYRGIPTQLEVAGDQVVCSNGVAICGVDIKSGEVLWSKQVEVEGRPVETLGMAVLDDDRVVLVSNNHQGGDSGIYSAVSLLDPASGEAQAEYQVPLSDYASGFDGACLCSDGKSLVLGLPRNGAAGLTLLNLQNGETTSVVCKHMMLYGLSCLDGVIYAGSSENASNLCSIEAFDESLTPLWTFETQRESETSGAELRSLATKYYQDVRACNVLPQYGSKGSQVVCIMGYQLFLLDTSDGSETFSLTAPAPICDCNLHGESNTSWASMVCANGEVVQRKLYERGYNAPIGIEDGQYDTSMGLIDGAIMTEAGDRGIVLVTKASQPSRLSTYSFVYGNESTFGKEHGALEMPFVSDNVIWAKDVVAWVDCDERCLVVCNRDDFSLRYRTPLPDPFWKGNFDLPSECYLQLTPQGNFLIFNRFGQIVLVAGEDGSVTGSYALPNTILEEGEIASMPLENGGEVFVMLEDPEGVNNSHGVVARSIYVMDDFNGYARSVIRRDDLGGIERVIGLVQDTKLLLLENTGQDPVPKLMLVDSQTGEDIACDLTGTRLLDQRLYSYDGNRVVAVLENHDIACYDAREGKMLWQVQAMQSKPQFLCFDEKGNVVVQDETGILMLRSGETGAVIATSSTVLKPIESAEVVDSTTLLANYRQVALFGVAAISTNEEHFGPYSSVSRAYGMSTDASKALVKKLDGGEPVVMSLYTLDELVEQAKETVKGFELSDDERHLYRIAQ